MRLLLYPFALLYGLVVIIRRTFYQWGIFKRRSFDKPIICVGNLSVGGTGKSPMVLYLAKLLGSTHNVATLSRGYGRKTRGFRKVEIHDTAENTGDEPLMFTHALPQAQVFVGEDRCAAVDTILKNHLTTQAIILDDAYQHMKIKAGFNVLITRFSSPFWKDHMLPAGNLREPANGAARAQMVVITGCPENLRENDKKSIVQTLKKYTSAEVFFAGVKYGVPQPVFGKNNWKNRFDSLLCVSGIADPTAFEQHAATFASRVECLAFGDHHTFTEADMNKIAEAYEGLRGEKAILTTAKDRVRMLSSAPCLNMLKESDALFYQPMELVILDDPKRFDQRILNYAQTHS